MNWVRRRAVAPVAPVALAAPEPEPPAWLDPDAAWVPGQLVDLAAVAQVLGVHPTAMPQRAAMIGVAVIESDRVEFVSRPGALALVEGVRP